MRLGSSDIQTTTSTTSGGVASTNPVQLLLGSSGLTMARLQSSPANGVIAAPATTLQQIPSMAQLVGAAAVATPRDTVLHRGARVETVAENTIQPQATIATALQQIPSMAQLTSSAVARDTVVMHRGAQEENVTENSMQATSAAPTITQHLSTPTSRSEADRRPSPQTQTISLPSHFQEEEPISSPKSAASTPSPRFLMNDSYNNSNAAEQHIRQPQRQRSPLTKDQRSSTCGGNSSFASTASAAAAASLLLLISNLRETLAPLFPTSTFAHRGSLSQSATAISSFDFKGRRTLTSESALHLSGRDTAGVRNSSSIGAGSYNVIPLLHQRSSLESNNAAISQQLQQNYQALRLPFHYRQSFSSISQNGGATRRAVVEETAQLSPRQTLVGVPRPPPTPSSVYFMRLTQLPSDETRNNEISPVFSLSPHAEGLLQPPHLNAAPAEIRVTNSDNQQHGISTPNQTQPSQQLESERIPAALGANEVASSPRLVPPAGRSPVVEGGCSRDDLLVSVAHPGVAASSLLVSFGRDNDVAHGFEDDDEDTEDDTIDDDDEEIDSSRNRCATRSKPLDGEWSLKPLSTAVRAILEPRPPHQQPPSLAPRNKFQDVATTTTTTTNPSPTMTAATPTPSLPPPPPPSSLFSLTPIINNNYVLLGGLGKYQWTWNEAVEHHHRRHHFQQQQQPSDPTSVSSCSVSPHARPITMREDVLLAFSLKEKEAVVIKMISPLSSLAYLSSPHHRYQGVGGVSLPLTPQSSEDAIALPNVMGTTVVATGRALRQARIASGVAELKKLVSLRHPNIVTLMDVLVDATAGCFYLVQEHCDAGTISDYFSTYDGRGPLIHKGEKRESPQEDIRDYPTIAKCLVHVLRGLLYLHQHGVAHRSITLGTILVTSNGVARLSGAALPPECSRHSAASEKDHSASAFTPTCCHDGSALETTFDNLFVKDIVAVGQSFASLMPEESEVHAAAYPSQFSGGKCSKEQAPPSSAPVTFGQRTSQPTHTARNNIRSQLTALLLEMSTFRGVEVGTGAELRSSPPAKEDSLLVTEFLNRAEALC
ncbi:Hypothetical protein, putative [Bodo saltans]|uniref:Protein kinase domain-containing protein n=1 Tax=Bodo saltans TaxID=75058 RepID=A0A0S4JGK2_BODSA|nr:Hypothetical protein, putative [Bodo saltans]|eukprot:CUG90667.1 Hypothetical protein, putative [Bodo saltans]